MRISILRAWAFVSSQVSYGKPRLQFRVWEDGTVLTDECRAELATAAESHGALHVALHGKEDPLRGDAAMHQLSRNHPHHDLRTYDEAHRARWIELRARNKRRDRPDLSLPGRHRRVYGEPDINALP